MIARVDVVVQSVSQGISHRRVSNHRRAADREFASIVAPCPRPRASSIYRSPWVVIKLVVSRVRAWIAPSSRVDANQRLESTSIAAKRRAASPRGVFILNTHRERAVHMSKIFQERSASFEVASRDMHSVVCE